MLLAPGESGSAEIIRPVTDCHHFDQISDGKDPDDFLVFSHRQVANAFGRHPFTGVADGAIDIDVEQGRVHEGAHSHRLRIELVGEQLPHQVAFGDDAHQFVGFDHEQRPDVFVGHALCGGHGGFFAAADVLFGDDALDGGSDVDGGAAVQGGGRWA